MATNPRYKNGNLRRKYRARLKAMAAPCGICQGRLGPIHYDEPSNAKHPLSFVIDERYPVSRYKEFGYRSKEEAAQDWGNIQAAHYLCNAQKRDKTMREMLLKNARTTETAHMENENAEDEMIRSMRERLNESDGEW